MTRLSPFYHADTALSQPWRSDCLGGQPLPCHARHVTTSSHIVLSIVKRGKPVSAKTADCIHPMLARGSGRMHEHAASVMWLSCCCSAPELLHCTLIAPTKTRSSENSGSSTRYAFEEKRMVRSLAEIKRYISQPGLPLHVKSGL